MGATLKIANLWRVIREVDLQAIRGAALAPFELWLIDDGFDQADRMRHWLSAGEQPMCDVERAATTLRRRPS
jgi:hypothetical protein